MAGAKKASITLTYGRLIAGVLVIVAAIGGGVGYIAYMIGKDVSAIHASLDAARKEAVSSSSELRSDIAALTAELKVTNTRLAGLANAPAPDKIIKVVDEKLTKSIYRQQDFERWVITRLGPTPVPARLPEGWYKPQVDIINRIKAGGEPLAAWVESSDFKQ